MRDLTKEWEGRAEVFVLIREELDLINSHGAFTIFSGWLKSVIHLTESYWILCFKCFTNSPLRCESTISSYCGRKGAFLRSTAEPKIDHCFSHMKYATPHNRSKFISRYWGPINVPSYQLWQAFITNIIYKRNLKTFDLLLSGTL